MKKQKKLDRLDRQPEPTHTKTVCAANTRHAQRPAPPCVRAPATLRLSAQRPPAELYQPPSHQAPRFTPPTYTARTVLYREAPRTYLVYGTNPPSLKTRKMLLAPRPLLAALAVWSLERQAPRRQTYARHAQSPPGRSRSNGSFLFRQYLNQVR